MFRKKNYASPETFTPPREVMELTFRRFAPEPPEVMTEGRSFQLVIGAKRPAMITSLCGGSGTAHCTLHAAHCTPHTVHFTLHTTHYTLHTVHSRMFTTYCTLYTEH